MVRIRRMRNASRTCNEKTDSIEAFEVAQIQTLLVWPQMLEK